jgi:hypothetical protein
LRILRIIRNFFDNRQSGKFLDDRDRAHLLTQNDEDAQNTMTRNAVIEISLFEESSEKTNKELEREISEELSENTRLIP